MGFFSDIKDKIFGKHEAQPTIVAQAAAQASPSAAPAAPAPSRQPAGAAASPAAVPSPVPTAPAAQGNAAAAPAATGASSGAQVDVAAILDAAVAKSGQTLDWRKSIVDLMKALGIDSSLAARKELAQELNYTGSTEDSAAMNIWLHKAVIQKLADNGGKVPAELL
ncbi:DUF3597 domain-containing protein [Devosia sp. 1566]|uniref:DUF3597 domain-containing protein n=1 Tax=Devosia sp. 1566 TaxID=2499144 RepID=UPI000FD6F45B|nr:DUF3597 domain-containing protein [Devosia sp. 1566]